MLQALGFLISALLAPWESYWIPAGSMKPALIPGDVVLALPSRGRVRPGDVVILRHPTSDADYIKRVVATAGDRVQMRGGVLHLNGAPVGLAALGDHVEPVRPAGSAIAPPRCAETDPGGDCRKRMLLETLPGGHAYPVLDIERSALDDTAETTVPAGHVFVLGDNRDNSIDSRVPVRAGGLGMVPLAAIHARPILIFYSSTGRVRLNPATRRAGRILQVIR